jgi:hypothetical protein
MTEELTIKQRLDAMRTELSKITGLEDLETTYPDLHERAQKLWADLGGMLETAEHVV